MSSYEHVWMMIGLNFQMNKDAIALILRVVYFQAENTKFL